MKIPGAAPGKKTSNTSAWSACTKRNHLDKSYVSCKLNKIKVNEITMYSYRLQIIREHHLSFC